MATGISDETIAIVKATAPLVKENAEKITSTFYPKLLGRHPVRKERVIVLLILFCIIVTLKTFGRTAHTAVFPFAYTVYSTTTT